MRWWGRRWVELQRGIFRGAQRLVIPSRRGVPHLETGLRGEAEALFELRSRGHVVVAQRWTSVKSRGDVDLIAWDGEWLCFIEVKTRSTRGIVPADFAVDKHKQEMLRDLAGLYLGGLGDREARAGILTRFDVIAVYLLPRGAEFDLYPAAF